MNRNICAIAMHFARVAVITSMMCAPLLAGAQANLLTNGSFEVDSDGHALSDNGGTYSDWRLVGQVTGGVGAATVRAAAATQGSVGLELAHTSGLSWFDRWDSLSPTVNKPGVYMLLADMKNGGVYGGQDSVLLNAVVHNSNATYPEFPHTCTPGTDFETFGTCALATSLAQGLDARLWPSATANQSFFVDNMRLYDVTETNRVINGGFENSATRLLNWRTYSLAAGEFTTSLSTDVHGGARALLIDRTGSTNGGAIDLTGEGMIPTIGGERMQFRFWAKKVSGDTDTRLAVMIQEYDANDTWLGFQNLTFFHPDTSAYQRCSTQVTLNAATAKVGLAFLVGDNANGVQHVGSYLIDDVDFRRTDNLLLNGDFEFNIDGDDSVDYWREVWPANVNIATRAAAASDGGTGAEISQAAVVPGNNFIDRWDYPAGLVALPGIYKMMIDAKDGGLYGGEDNLQFFACLHDSPYPLYGTTLSPGVEFESFGLTLPVAADRTGIDVRLVPSGTANQSFYADNIRVVDVTNGERAVNGGFENSTSQLANWRYFSLQAGEFTAALDSDAYQGAQAVRIERSGVVNDGAVDLENDKIAVIPGETLNIRMAVKKLSGDASTRLFVSIGQYDNAQSYLGGAFQVNAALDAGTEYQVFNVPITMDAAAGYINVGLRVGDNAGSNRHIGAYLVDALSIQRNSAPSFSSAGLAFNGHDYTSIRVVTSGWSDADADNEHYTYQWKLNGTAIPGATAPEIDRAVYGGNPDTLTCVVTAFDGKTAGNTIETAVVPVELSSFDVE